MSMITLEHEISEQEYLLEISREELRRLMTEIKTLRARLERGQVPESLGQCPDINRLTKLVSSCIETETRIGKCREQQAGIAQCGFAFNLEEAKSSIGSKLDKLRAARDAE